MDEDIFWLQLKDGYRWGYFVAATKMGTMDGDFFGRN